MEDIMFFYPELFLLIFLILLISVLRVQADWFKPKVTTTDLPVMLTIGLFGSYLSTNLSLEGLILIALYELWREWYFRKHGRYFLEKLKIAVDKILGQ